MNHHKEVPMTHSEQRCGDRVIVYRCPKHGYTTQANPVGEDARCGVMVNRTPGETCYELVEGPWDAVIQEADCTPADTEGGERCPACGGTGLLAAMSPERHGMDEISRCPAVTSRCSGFVRSSHPPTTEN